MLSDEDITWLILVAKQRLRDVSEPKVGASIRDRLAKIEKELEQPVTPLELLIHCPRCKNQHVDEGRFATDPHKIHACQFCGLGFVVSKQPSIGVQFFDGWKNPIVGWLLGDTKLEPSSKPPTVSPPPGYILLSRGTLQTGGKVRFKEEAQELGYDTSKVYEIAEVSGQLSVRLEGDPLPVPFSLLEQVLE